MRPSTRATSTKPKRSTAGRAPRCLSPDTEAAKPQLESRRAKSVARRKTSRSHTVRATRARPARAAPAAAAAMDLEPPQETEIDAAETIAQMGETEEDFDESEALEVEEVSPKYALIVGGRAMTTASNTAVPLETDERNKPYSLASFISVMEMSDADFTNLLADGDRCERTLHECTWELMRQAMVSISSGADAIVDHWRLHVDTADEIVQKAKDAGEDASMEYVQEWYFGTNWNELDLGVRPLLFVSEAGKLVPTFNGRALVRHLRRIGDEAKRDLSASPLLTFCLRPANTAAAGPQRAEAPRRGGHGGSRPNAGRPPASEKKVCLILHTGTKQTQTNGAQVKFYRTDVGDPLMVVKKLTELPETVRAVSSLCLRACMMPACIQLYLPLAVAAVATTHNCC